MLPLPNLGRGNIPKEKGAYILQHLILISENINFRLEWSNIAKSGNIGREHQPQERK